MFAFLLSFIASTPKDLGCDIKTGENRSYPGSGSIQVVCTKWNESYNIRAKIDRYSYAISSYEFTPIHVEGQLFNFTYENVSFYTEFITFVALSSDNSSIEAYSEVYVQIYPRLSIQTQNILLYANAMRPNKIELKLTKSSYFDDATIRYAITAEDQSITDFTNITYMIQPVHIGQYYTKFSFNFQVAPEIISGYYKLHVQLIDIVQQGSNIATIPFKVSPVFDLGISVSEYYSTNLSSYTFTNMTIGGFPADINFKADVNSVEYECSYTKTNLTCYFHDLNGSSRSIYVNIYHNNEFQRSADSNIFVLEKPVITKVQLLDRGNVRNTVELMNSYSIRLDIKDQLEINTKMALVKRGITEFPQEYSYDEDNWRSFRYYKYSYYEYFFSGRIEPGEYTILVQVINKPGMESDIVKLDLTIVLPTKPFNPIDLGCNITTGKNPYSLSTSIQVQCENWEENDTIIAKFGSKTTDVQAYDLTPTKVGDKLFNITIGSDVTYTDCLTLAVVTKFNASLIEKMSTLELEIYPEPVITEFGLKYDNSSIFISSTYWFIVAVPNFYPGELKAKIALVNGTDTEFPEEFNKKQLSLLNESYYTFCYTIPQDITPGNYTMLIQVCNNLEAESNIMSMNLTITEKEYAISCTKIKNAYNKHSKSVQAKCYVRGYDKAQLRASVDRPISFENACEYNYGTVTCDFSGNTYVSPRVHFALIDSSNNTLDSTSLDISLTSIQEFNIVGYRSKPQIILPYTKLAFSATLPDETRSYLDGSFALAEMNATSMPRASTYAQLTQNGSTYDFEYQIPENAKPGTYKLMGRVLSRSGEYSEIAQFIVIVNNSVPNNISCSPIHGSNAYTSSDSTVRFKCNVSTSYTNTSVYSNNQICSFANNEYICPVNNYDSTYNLVLYTFIDNFGSRLAETTLTVDTTPPPTVSDFKLIEGKPIPGQRKVFSVFINQVPFEKIKYCKIDFKTSENQEFSENAQVVNLVPYYYYNQYNFNYTIPADALAGTTYYIHLRAYNINEDYSDSILQILIPFDLNCTFVDGTAKEYFNSTDSLRLKCNFDINGKDGYSYQYSLYPEPMENFSKVSFENGVIIIQVSSIPENSGINSFKLGLFKGNEKISETIIEAAICSYPRISNVVPYKHNATYFPGGEAKIKVTVNSFYNFSSYAKIEYQFVDDINKEFDDSIQTATEHPIRDYYYYNDYTITLKIPKNITVGSAPFLKLRFTDKASQSIVLTTNETFRIINAFSISLFDFAYSRVPVEGLNSYSFRVKIPISVEDELAVKIALVGENVSQFPDEFTKKILTKSYGEENTYNFDYFFNRNITTGNYKLLIKVVFPSEMESDVASLSFRVTQFNPRISCQKIKNAYNINSDSVQAKCEVIGLERGYLMATHNENAGYIRECNISYNGVVNCDFSENTDETTIVYFAIIDQYRGTPLATTSLDISLVGKSEFAIRGYHVKPDEILPYYGIELLAFVSNDRRYIIEGIAGLIDMNQTEMPERTSRISLYNLHDTSYRMNYQVPWDAKPGLNRILAQIISQTGELSNIADFTINVSEYINTSFQCKPVYGRNAYTYSDKTVSFKCNITTSYPNISITTVTNKSEHECKFDNGVYTCPVVNTDEYVLYLKSAINTGNVTIGRTTVEVNTLSPPKAAELQVKDKVYAGRPSIFNVAINGTPFEKIKSCKVKITETPTTDLSEDAQDVVLSQVSDTDYLFNYTIPESAFIGSTYYVHFRVYNVNDDYSDVSLPVTIHGKLYCSFVEGTEKEYFSKSDTLRFNCNYDIKGRDSYEYRYSFDNNNWNRAIVKDQEIQVPYENIDKSYDLIRIGLFINDKKTSTAKIFAGFCAEPKISEPIASNMNGKYVAGGEVKLNVTVDQFYGFRHSSKIEYQFVDKPEDSFDKPSIATRLPRLVDDSDKNYYVYVNVPENQEPGSEPYIKFRFTDLANQSVEFTTKSPFPLVKPVTVKKSTFSFSPQPVVKPPKNESTSGGESSGSGSSSGGSSSSGSSSGGSTGGESSSGGSTGGGSSEGETSGGEPTPAESEQKLKVGQNISVQFELSDLPADWETNTKFAFRIGEGETIIIDKVEFEDVSSKRRLREEVQSKVVKLTFQIPEKLEITDKEGNTEINIYTMDKEENIVSPPITHEIAIEVPPEPEPEPETEDDTDDDETEENEIPILPDPTATPKPVEKPVPTATPKPNKEESTKKPTPEDNGQKGGGLSGGAAAGIAIGVIIAIAAIAAVLVLVLKAKKANGAQQSESGNANNEMAETV